MEDEIAAVYEKEVDDGENVELDLANQATLTESILSLVANTTGQALAADADFFGAGFDSLKVITMARMLGSV